MKTYIDKKLLTSMKAMLSSEDPNRFLDRFVQNLIENFQISFCFLYSKGKEGFELNKIWNNKVSNFPLITNEDILIRMLERAKYIHFNGESLSENDIELKDDSIVYNAFKNLSVSLAFMVNIEEKNTGILFFGNKDDHSEYNELEIHAVRDLIQELEIIIPNFYIIKNNITNEKLSLMSPTLSLISHDVRNPIQMISILTEMLQAKELPYEKRINLYHRINDGLNQINSIVSEISEFARGKYDLEYTRIDCKKFFADIRSSIYDSLKKLKIELEMNIDFNGTINIDIKKIKNIILKILKFSRDIIQYDGLIALNVSNKDEKMIISIQDTGEAIQAEILKNIYDPFFSFGNKKGVGLNFAISKKIIEEHHGSFEIFSKIDEGTRYIIQLPLNI
jgi:signal transduction histidine kinase